jgi:hypothetical protein
MVNDEARTGKSAAWGVSAAVAAAGAVALWQAAHERESHFPIWPFWVAAATGAVLLYLCFATVWNWFPVRRPTLPLPPPPIEESLQKALNVQKSQCQAAGRPYYTLDTLLTLLAVANGRAARCFDIVKPGWATEVRTRLHEHAAELKNEGFVPFEWTERPEVQEAQAAAKRSQARAVTDVHLLLGVLDTPSNTLTDLEKTYGDNVSQLRTAATKAAAQRAVSPTPGVGDAANNTI